MNEFLKPGKYVDSDHPEVVRKALALSSGVGDRIEIARADLPDFFVPFKTGL